MAEWRALIAETARKAPCIECSTMASWHPKKWYFRHVPTPGGKRHDPKVKTERLCPECARARGVDRGTP